MIDPKLLRNDLQKTVDLLKTRGYDLDIEQIQQLEEKRKKYQTISENIQAKKNSLSQQIGQAKKSGADDSDLLSKVQELADQEQNANEQFQTAQKQLNDILSFIPNLPDKSVPVGFSEDGNQEIRRFKSPKTFDFKVKEHADLENIGLDFNNGTKICGSRFTVIKGDLARLHRALTQFMLDFHLKNGYQEYYVPYIANASSLFNTGQLPKFADELFKTQLGERDLYLIPTAEVSLTNIAANQIFLSKELPQKLTAHTPCFRSEAGSYGKDIRGIIRQHQFDKVEMVQFTTPDQSDNALEEMVNHAEQILQALDLPYRVMLLCTGDMGFSAQKTYDLEVWLPGQQKYREISSCSNCGNFQARRLKARFRNNQQEKPQLIHTLNGSGLAIGRTLVAILENYQNSDGSISIPEALRNYLNGLTKINP